MRFSHIALPVVGMLVTGSAFAQPASSVHTYQEFSTHLLSAQSHNHLLGEFGTGSEDSVDFDSLRLAGEFDVANLRVAQTPVELSLIGQYQTVDVEVDGPPAAPRPLPWPPCRGSHEPHCGHCGTHWLGICCRLWALHP